MQQNKAFSTVKRFRMIGLLEGSSFLILLLIGMPLKYMAGIPEVVKFVGWAHGLLFILFILGIFQVKNILKWSPLQILAASVASVVPFGTFVLDKSIKKQEAVLLAENAVTEKV